MSARDARQRSHDSKRSPPGAGRPCEGCAWPADHRAQLEGMDRLHRHGTRGVRHPQAGTHAAHHAADDCIRRPGRPQRSRRSQRAEAVAGGQAAQALMHARRLLMPVTLPLAKTFRREPLDFRVSRAAIGNATFGARGDKRRLDPGGTLAPCRTAAARSSWSRCGSRRGGLIGCPADQPR